VARDEINNLILPSNQGSGFAFLDQNVTSGVLRYRRDIGRSSALGVLYTGREGDDYHNHVAGLDGFIRFTQSDTIRVQYLRSETQYPERIAASSNQPLDSFSGDGFRMQYDHFAQNWKGFVAYQDLDPLFRSDSGFIPRVDVRTGEAQFERFFYGDRDDWYARWSLGARGLRTEDHGGRLTDENLQLFGTLNGPLQSLFDVSVARNQEYFNGTTFELDQQAFFFQINPTGKLRLRLNTRFGDQIDYANTRLGEITHIAPGAQVRIGRSVNLQLDHILQTLDVDGGELFEVNLTQLGLIYQFNVRTFVRAIVQYQDLQRDPDLYAFEVDPQTEDFFGQFLFSYKLNPQTVLFLGYTDTRFGVQGIDLTQTDRTFFLKLGYALLY
jgi:hypothetical protein